MPRIDAFLKLAAAQNCSDMHLAVGVPPMLRMHGDLVPIKFRDLSVVELESYVQEIMSSEQQRHFAQGHDIDFAYVTEDGKRFRANLFRKDSGPGAVFRTIPTSIPSLQSLKCPPIITKFCDYHQGMVLVTGATGTGKSTTLAAMIDHINETRNLNIITLEDPIEFVHPSKQSQIIQRELNTHIPSFAEGVRAAMREDPDVILVGELRDAETIRWAMTAAETGHLVLGTLHTTGAVKTLDRLGDALPADEREQIKSFLGNNLLGVVSQILIKTPDLRGRRAVHEIMVMNRAIGKLIMTDQNHMIPSQLQMGRDVGMQTLDQALLAGIKSGDLHPGTAAAYAVDKSQFAQYLDDAPAPGGTTTTGASQA